ncbi:hypothetical protein HOE67_03460 [Candidatus Peregrinibacteria bacterium]|jgi:hypothetical protein|nr:hypothetical protein [Candidatus Peregrinibacteria bacterium]MBT4056142.1 hypothetical protein [Candidatus Peregrinibacteria bacterium]
MGKLDRLLKDVFRASSLVRLKISDGPVRDKFLSKLLKKSDSEKRAVIEILLGYDEQKKVADKKMDSYLEDALKKMHKIVDEADVFMSSIASRNDGLDIL